VKRTRVVAAKTALATGALALGLAGCAVTSPAVIRTPYPASDGIDADLPGTDVGLRNLIVIGAAKGSEAELIGSVINTGTSDARINLQAAVGESGQPSQTTVAVGAGETVQFGPGDNQTPVTITDLAVAPGDVTGLTASTTSGGRVDVSVPVLTPEGTYAGITPPASAAPEPTGSPSSTADTGTGQSESEGNATESATPQTTNNSKQKKKKNSEASPDASQTSTAG
jgi:hypothetical protein